MPITNEILERAYLTGNGEAMTESSESVQTNLAQERGGSHWYAAYTASCREKRVVEHLASRDIESFLPLYRSRRRWKNGCCVELERPLFPGYVFVRMARVERTRILEVPGVLSIVSRGRTPEALQDDTIAILRANHQLWRAEPHPYLVVGEHVLVHAGPFAGLSGIVLRHKGTLRVVVTLNLIMRSMAIELNVEDLEAVPQFPANSLSEATPLC